MYVYVYVVVGILLSLVLKIVIVLGFRMPRGVLLSFYILSLLLYTMRSRPS